MSAVSSCIDGEADTFLYVPLQTEAAKAAITELLDVEAEAKAYANALSALHSSYAPSERTSDFAQTLDKGAKRMLPIMRCITSPEP